MKKIKKIFIATVITSSLIVVPALASPNVNQIEQNKEETEKKLEDANSKLVTLLTDFEVLKGDIRNQEAKITLADKDLQEAKKKEEEQYKQMLIRIKYMYENGDGNEISALLGAESFGEVINQVEYMKNVHSYDRKMLNEYKKSKEKVATLKQDLESGKADMEFMATTYEQQEKELKTTIETMKTQVADFDVQLANAQRQAEEEARRLEQQTQQMEAELSDTKPSKPQTNRPSSNNDNNDKDEEDKPSTPKPDKPSKPSKPDKPSKPTEPEAEDKPSNASKGQQIANEGLKYVGNPYVWGGNDLYNGIDCSGFTQQIFGHFGYSLPRTSGAQASSGIGIKYSQHRAGDLIVYPGHVAILTGDGGIVHASNSAPYPKGGIKYTANALYRDYIAVRRIVK